MLMTSSSRSRKFSAARRSLVSSPAVVESLEQKLLLTTPELITPTGTIDGAAAPDGTERQIEFSWNAVDNAVSYDVWVSSLNSFEQILLLENVPGTVTNVPISDLADGGNRVWVRANLEGGSNSAWSSAADFHLNLVPSLTGPIGMTGQNIVDDSTPTVSWVSAQELNGFQLWLTDVNTSEIRRYSISNVEVDEDGDPVLDDEGVQIPAEQRSFEIPDELPMSHYRLWIRGIDQDGNPGSWSRSHDFRIGTRPTDLAPGYETPVETLDGSLITHQPTFERTPRLTWDAVPGATNYEVWVATDPSAGAREKLSFPAAEDANGRVITSGTAFRIPQPLLGGNYIFWVRAMVQSETAPTVIGAWSEPSRFSTAMPPVLLGPSDDTGVIADREPTITWNQVHGAAAYEVLVHRQNSPPPYLQQVVADNSLTMTNGVVEGSYTVWVRAIGGDGTQTSWSQPLYFNATGGRPAVFVNQSPDDPFFPEIEWAGYDDAISYDIWVSYIGVDFDFITQSITDKVGDTDVVVTSYTPNMPLSEGDYRVWVRAILPTGATSWSAPVDFTVTGLVQTDDPDQPMIQLASVQSKETVEAVNSADTEPQRDVPPSAGPEVPVRDAERMANAEAVEADLSTEQPLAAELLENLAENCVQSEWWMAPKQV